MAPQSKLMKIRRLSPDLGPEETFMSSIKVRIGTASTWDAKTNEWSQDQTRPA